MAKDNELPTRDKCDESRPDERFLWTMVGLPDVIGALLVLPVPMLRKISEHLVKCGVMLECPACGHREDPEIRFRISPGDDPMMGGGGQWVPADTPIEADDVLAERMREWSPQLRRAIAERLAEDHPSDEALQKMAGRGRGRA